MRASVSYKMSVIGLILAATQAGPPAIADATTDQTLGGSSGYTYAPTTSGTVPDALQPPKVEKKKGPLTRFVKGMGKELGTSMDDMGKDMVLIFSVQDIDPYEKKVDQSKPYEMSQIRWMDGSGASVTRYPDGSIKVHGGFSDGMVIVPMGGTMFDVLYPNGLKGRLEKIPGGGARIYRPDNSVTTISRNMSGSYAISNDKQGYMGLATPDQTGLRYEMSTGSY